MTEMPTCKVYQISECPEGIAWMIEGLWLDNGVGIIGGEPKSFKTFAAPSLAVAISSGKQCFGRYAVHRRGPVLLYAAEDSLPIVKERIRGISEKIGADFNQLDINVITSQKLRIDSEIDRRKMEATISEIKPVLLILDPFVRLHGIDENSSGEVAKILSWLRDLQRQHSLNIAMVHHARKRAGKERPGQSLRGSSELHAWGDSNLYLRRAAHTDDCVELTIEHRAAPSSNGNHLRLDLTHDQPVLIFESGAAAPTSDNLSAEQRIGGVLRGRRTPMTGDELRSECKMKSSTFWAALNRLIEMDKIERLDTGGYQSLPSLLS
jgi:RecA-family ATPase